MILALDLEINMEVFLKPHLSFIEEAKENWNYMYIYCTKREFYFIGITFWHNFQMTMAFDTLAFN